MSYLPRNEYLTAEVRKEFVILDEVPASPIVRFKSKRFDLTEFGSPKMPISLIKEIRKRGGFKFLTPVTAKPDKKAPTKVADKPTTSAK